MPKRTRDGEMVKSSPAPQQLSALAQRRLRQQQNTPAAPVPEAEPPAKKRLQATAVVVETPSRKPQKEERRKKRKEGQNRVDTDAGDLKKQREDIETRIRERVIALKGQTLQTTWGDGEGFAGAYRTAIVDERIPTKEEQEEEEQVKDESGEDEDMPDSPPEETILPAEHAPPRAEESALARIRRRRSQEAAPTEDTDDPLSAAESSSSEEPAVAPTPPKGPVKVSNFTPTLDNYLTTDLTARFRLLTDETLVLVGEYVLTVLTGTVRIAAAALTADSRPQKVYAPVTHALPVIEAGDGIRRKGKKGEMVAEVLIESSWSGLGDMGRVCPSFGGIWSMGPDKNSNPRWSFQPIFTITSPPSTLTVSPAWANLLRTLTAPSSSTTVPIILLTGSKSTGKSTFSRLLTNAFLTSPTPFPHIYYVDLDPGQPEFSPAGVLTLQRLTTQIFGPPFTHALPPSTLRAQHIGYSSPREDPPAYLSAAADLLSHLREQPPAPVIINTAGWTKGIGLELLGEIATMSAATDIIFLGPQHGSGVAELATQNVRFWPAEPVGPEAAGGRYSPADLRALGTTCYFHACGEGQWDFSTPMTGMLPWIVPYRGAERGIEGVCVLGEQITQEDVKDAIEGTIVGLVTIPPIDTEEGAEGCLQLLEEEPRGECVGLAVVRAVDEERGEVQLVTSVSEEVVERWDCEGLGVALVRGRGELPVWEYLVEGVRELPWVSFGGSVEGKGGAVWRVRRNLMRKSQMVGR